MRILLIILSIFSIGGSIQFILSRYEGAYQLSNENEATLYWLIFLVSIVSLFVASHKKEEKNEYITLKASDNGKARMQKEVITVIADKVAKERTEIKEVRTETQAKKDGVYILIKAQPNLEETFVFEEFILSVEEEIKENVKQYTSVEIKEIRFDFDEKRKK